MPVWSTEVGDPERPLVVLIHGSMDRSAGLLKLSRRLDDRYRVMRYDRRGYGRSRPHDGPFTMDAQVADLQQLLAGRTAVLVGHSYGGDVALAAAQRLGPPQVHGAVVYEAPLSWRSWWPGSTAGAAVTQGDVSDVAERFMTRLIGKHRWVRLPPSTRAARRAEGPALVGELLALRAGAPWEPQRICVPVLALAGSAGADHHRASSRVIAGEIAGGRFAELQGARHFGPNTHPDDVAALIIDFIDSLD
jgi:pimeloyl-ACP methyl ester carboxylesterase